MSSQGPWGLALLTLVVSAGCATPSSSSPSRAPDGPLVTRLDRALARGAGYLIGRRSADGAWRSETYGAFSDGYALTPLATFAVLFSTRSSTDSTALIGYVNQACIFTAGLANPDAPATYPLYSAATGAMLLSLPFNERHRVARDALVQRVRQRQLDEAHGWSEADPSYGGWGYYRLAPTRPPDGAFRHELLSSNVSATLFALGALAMAEVPLDDPVYARARRFLGRAQNLDGDGGFFFTPDNPIQNKAGALGAGDEGYRSYGTMTADGVRALIRTGVPRTDPRVRRAAAWLHARFDPERAPGDYDDETERASAYYYWAWTAAHALNTLGSVTFRGPDGAVHWPSALAEALLARQRDDGAWKNDATYLREDDPILATAFAMSALALARMAITRQWRWAVD